MNIIDLLTREHSPLWILKQFLNQSKQNNSIKHTSAVCLSTLNSNNYPSGRFVDLKDVSSSGLTFCSSYESQKAIEIKNNPNVCMTGWWENINLQFRAIGTVVKESSAISDLNWDKRSYSAKAVSIITSQRPESKFDESVMFDYQSLLNKENILSLKRPETWGAYILEPIEIEIMIFEDSRFHKRFRYELISGKWAHEQLLP